MADQTPKSAYELVMERLRKRDAEAGIEPKALTDAQRAALADVRNVYEARLAERDVLHQSARAATLDPEARAAVDDEYRRDRERLNAERDAKLDGIRKGGAAG